MRMKRRHYPATLFFLSIIMLWVCPAVYADDIDVMMVFDNTAKTWVDTHGGMNAFAADAVAKMNQATTNSNVDLIFHLVHAAQVNYNYSGNLQTDLYALQAGTGNLSVVHDWRDTYAADLVAMLVDTGSAYGWIGQGYLLTTMSGSPAYGFTVNSIRSVDIKHTMTHEIGHNLGAHHSKDQVDDPGPNSALNTYSAGWYFTGTNTVDYHTIMAYNSDGNGTFYQSAPLFSTPLITYQGTAAGDADDGDNARTIRETMGVVSNYRGGPILKYWSHTIDDNPSGGSNGNDDGQVNPGEDIELWMTLKNTGNADAHNVSAELSTSDSYVTITDPIISSWHDIPAGTTKEENDFDFHVASDCPDGHNITFNLAISADEGNWNDSFSITVHSGSQTLSISGTVYESDGFTPITEGTIWAITGDPCGWYTSSFSGEIDVDGTYNIEDLPPGTYYLETESEGNYVDEWWADPSSVRDCSNAQSIAVTEGQAVKDKDFQLEAGVTISGSVYECDGTTPVTRGTVIAYSGDPCDNPLYSAGIGIKTDGTYIFRKIPGGTYYLQANTLMMGEEAVYIDEWWADPSSVIDCSSAQAIEVNAGEAITDRDFQLNLNILYVSNTGYCGDNEPCYNSIQAALDAALQGASIKVGVGTYNESPTWDTWGTVSISGGWNSDFTERIGTTEIYAPRVPGGGSLKVQPRVQVVAH
ncbi:MAG: hypothetical protein K9M96_10255 [Deltaproteobacteria bacterium]|nr:hypothetical protein [Deltaproteobacteria bacterium]